MPTFLTAKPNPVGITVWSYSQRGTTTISWDTGSSSSGTVWVTDGAVTQKFIDLKNKPAIGARGTATASIKLGQKLVFELKPTNNPARVLAVLVVEGREQSGLSTSMVADLRRRAPLQQGIFNVRVLPDVDWVRILFRTRQPTNPIIDVKDVSKGFTLAGAVFGRLSQTHDYTFELAQDSVFRFHIFAYSTDVGSSGAKPSPATAEGLFKTGSRSAQVFFDRVNMHTDGDPDGYGDGDFEFLMGAGGLGEKLSGQAEFSDEISGGEFRQLDRSVVIPSAPVGIWVQVIAEEDDTGLLSPFGEAREVHFAPEGSTWDTFDDRELSTVTKWFDLSDAGSVPQEVNFNLETGPKHVDFTLNCRLRMEAKPGAVISPILTKSLKPVVPAKPVAMLAAGHPVAVAGPRRTHVLALAQDGHLYQATQGSGGRVKAEGSEPRYWTSLASEVHEPLMVATAGDVLQLFSLDDTGQVLHRAMPLEAADTAPGSERWDSLGGSFVGPIAVSVDSGDVELFALSPDGGLFHKALGSDAGLEWQQIGEGIAGALNVFTTPRGEIGIVAIGRDGEIHHRQFSVGSVSAVGSTWQSIGPAPRGVLYADVFDDVVVLAATADDETVTAAAWRNYPESPQELDWLALGTLDSLLDTRFSLLPAATALPHVDSGEDAKEDGAALDTD